MFNRKINDVDINIIRRLFECDVDYHELSQVLILHIGTEDIIIPLRGITDRIYEEILPLCHQSMCMRMQFFITTKFTQYYQQAPISLVQIYELFKQLDDHYTIERYKGLGSMEPSDVYKTCLDPDIRRSYRIGSVGDIQTIFNMMCKDSQFRKESVLA